MAFSLKGYSLLHGACWSVSVHVTQTHYAVLLFLCFVVDLRHKIDCCSPTGKAHAWPNKMTVETIHDVSCSTGYEVSKNQMSNTLIFLFAISIKHSNAHSTETKMFTRQWSTTFHSLFSDIFDIRFSIVWFMPRQLDGNGMTAKFMKVLITVEWRFFFITGIWTGSFHSILRAH